MVIFDKLRNKKLQEISRTRHGRITYSGRYLGSIEIKSTENMENKNPDQIES